MGNLTLRRRGFNAKAQRCEGARGNLTQGRRERGETQRGIGVGRFTPPQVPALLVANEVCQALAYHDGGYVGVGANGVGHDGGVGDAEALDAVYSKMLIDDGEGV